MQQEGLGDRLTRKPLTADADEVAANPRSRSAKFRAIRFVGGGVKMSRPAFAAVDMVVHFFSSSAPPRMAGRLPSPEPGAADLAPTHTRPPLTDDPDPWHKKPKSDSWSAWR